MSADTAGRTSGHACSLARRHTRKLTCPPFFRPRIHMVSRESTSVRPRPNHSLKDLDTGFSSSWPQANLRYPAHAWRKASMTACWRSLGEAAGGSGSGPGQEGESPWGPQSGRLMSWGALTRATGRSGQHEGRGTARVRPSGLDRAVEVERHWGLIRQLGLTPTRPVPSTCRATGSPGEQRHFRPQNSHAGCAGNAGAGTSIVTGAVTRTRPPAPHEPAPGAFPQET